MCGSHRELSDFVQPGGRGSWTSMTSLTGRGHPRVESEVVPPSHLPGKGLLSGKAESSREASTRELSGTKSAVAEGWVQWPGKGPSRQGTSNTYTEAIPQVHESTMWVGKARGVILH